jgi:hypothetical protein
MESLKSLEGSLSRRLTNKHRTTLTLLFMMTITGGPVVSFLVSKIAPDTSGGAYAVGFQMLCLFSSLLLLRSFHAVRLGFIALFFFVVSALVFLGSRT